MTSPVKDAGDAAQDAAESAHDSDGRAGRWPGSGWLRAAWSGWCSGCWRSVLLVQGRQAETDQDGALQALQQTPVGTPLLLLLALGFAGYAAWLLLSAAVGHRDEDGRARTLARLQAARQGACVYAALCRQHRALPRARVSARGDPQSRTAEVMQAHRRAQRRRPGRPGPARHRALLRREGPAAQALRRPRALPRPRPPAAPGGRGRRRRLVGRGATFALVGAFFVRSAVQFDPDEAKGLDAALQTVAQQPYGRVLLSVAVVGVLAYALWSFVEAAYRRPLAGGLSARAGRSGSSARTSTSHASPGRTSRSYAANAGSCQAGHAAPCERRRRERLVDGQLVGQAEAEQEQPVDEQHGSAAAPARATCGPTGRRPRPTARAGRPRPATAPPGRGRPRRATASGSPRRPRGRARSAHPPVAGSPRRAPAAAAVRRCAARGRARRPARRRRRRRAARVRGGRRQGGDERDEVLGEGLGGAGGERSRQRRPGELGGQRHGRVGRATPRPRGPGRAPCDRASGRPCAGARRPRAASCAGARSARRWPARRPPGRRARARAA